MINQSDKIERFAEVINKNAQTQCKKIEKQTSKFQKKQQTSIEKEISAESERRLAYEIGRLRTETNREISRRQSESTQSISKRREEIENSVFSDAERKLAEFAKTAEYSSYLASCIKALFDAADGRLTVYVKADDLEEAEKIVSALGRDAEVRASGEIKIGGACAVNESGSVFVNNTLEAGLEEQRENFRLFSGLTINESR